MTTIRSKVPVLLSDLMLMGTEILIKYDVGGPMVSFKTRKGKTGHFHLSIVDSQYGYNSLQLEEALLATYNHALAEKEGDSGK